MTVADEPLDDGPTQDIMLHLQQLLLSEDIMTPQANGAGPAKSSDDYLDQLAPIIKDALVSQHAEELTNCLENITRTKDQEIEALCNGDQNVSQRRTCFKMDTNAIFRSIWRPSDS